MEEHNGTKLEQGDKVHLKVTAKGMIQWEVRIGSIPLNSEKNIDECIRLQKYTIDKLKQTYPRTLILEE